MAHNNTLGTLIERVLANIMPPGSWFAGTATGGSNDNVADTNGRNEEDDYFNSLPHAELYIRSTTDGAAPVGEVREIDDFTKLSGKVEVSDVFTAAIAQYDTYAILTDYSYSEVRGAINMAIDRARDEGILLEKIDEATELATATYDYAIPTGFTHIYRVTMADGTGKYLQPIPANQWHIIRGTATPMLRLAVFPDEQKHKGHDYGGFWADTSLTAGRLLRIEGLQAQEKLVNDTDICKLSPEFICYQVAAYLHGRRIKTAASDPDMHSTQAGYCQGKADASLKKMRVQFPADTRRVEL